MTTLVFVLSEMVLVVLIRMKIRVKLILYLLLVTATTRRLSSEVYGSNDGYYALYPSILSSSLEDD
jgi:hypothetical protein